MNYVWYHLKHNPAFWIKVVILPAVLSLTLLDFLTHMFNPPGVFNLWMLKSVAATAILATIGYGIYLYVSPKREKKITLNQFEFEKKREIELRRILFENPEFQTFCFTCRHFNQAIKNCSLDIRNSRARNMPLNEKNTYCLYWEEAGEQPISTSFE